MAFYPQNSKFRPRNLTQWPFLWGKSTQAHTHWEFCRRHGAFRRRALQRLLHERCGAERARACEHAQHDVVTADQEAAAGVASMPRMRPGARQVQRAAPLPALRRTPHRVRREAAPEAEAPEDGRAALYACALPFLHLPDVKCASLCRCDGHDFLKGAADGL